MKTKRTFADRLAAALAANVGTDRPSYPSALARAAKVDKAFIGKLLKPPPGKPPPSPSFDAACRMTTALGISLEDLRPD